MLTRMRKELFIFIALLLVLAVVQHSDLLTNPAERIESLLSGSASLFHPLYWTLGVYVVLGIARIILGLLRRLFRSKKVEE